MTESTLDPANKGQLKLKNRRKDSSQMNIPAYHQDEDDIRYEDILQLKLRHKIKLRSEDMAAQFESSVFTENKIKDVITEELAEQRSDLLDAFGGGSNSEVSDPDEQLSQPPTKTQRIGNLSASANIQKVKSIEES